MHLSSSNEEQSMSRKQQLLVEFVNTRTCLRNIASLIDTSYSYEMSLPQRKDRNDGTRWHVICKHEKNYHTLFSFRGCMSLNSFLVHMAGGCNSHDLLLEARHMNVFDAGLFKLCPAGIVSNKLFRLLDTYVHSLDSSYPAALVLSFENCLRTGGVSTCSVVARLHRCIKDQPFSCFIMGYGFLSILCEAALLSMQVSWKLHGETSRKNHIGEFLDQDSTNTEVGGLRRSPLCQRKSLSHVSLVILWCYRYRFCHFGGK